METEELKNIWQAYDAKLERSLKLNIRCIEEIQSQKVRSKIKSILILRIIEMIMALLVVFFLVGFLYKHFFEIKFAAMAAILICLYVISFVNCIKQIIIIKQIDYSKNVADIQKNLNLLQLHIVNHMRMIFLSIPTYLAYPVILFKSFTDFDIISKLDRNWWISQVALSIAIIPFCLFLYREVTYKNMHKKWVRVIIKNLAGDTVTKAMDFTKEIDEFKKELA